MAGWHEVPPELAERQEDMAQDPHYDHDAYRHFWNGHTQRPHPFDAPMYGPGSGLDMDGVPTI